MKIIKVKKKIIINKKRKKKEDQWEVDPHSDYPVHEKYTEEEPVKH